VRLFLHGRNRHRTLCAVPSYAALLLESALFISMIILECPGDERRGKVSPGILPEGDCPVLAGLRVMIARTWNTPGDEHTRHSPAVTPGKSARGRLLVRGTGLQGHSPEYVRAMPGLLTRGTTIPPCKKGNFLLLFRRTPLLRLWRPAAPSAW
jgi:hypothetical protein